MSREEVHKLIGGYATGTLTPEEREALFRAALEDQELFDTLAREEVLHELLSDPGAKAEVLAAMEERPARWYQGWGWMRPASVALAMAGVAVLAVISLRPRMAPMVPVMAPAPEVAQVRPAAPAAGDMLLAPGGAPAGISKQASPGVTQRAKKLAVAPAPFAPAPAPAASGGGGGGGRAFMARKEETSAEASLKAPLRAPMAAAPMAAEPPLPMPVVGGTVTDASGAAIHEATVTVASGNLAIDGQATTDAQGNWSIGLPRPGPYQVTVAAPGFKTEKAGIELRPADVKQIKTQLDVGSAAETVQVTAGNAAITPFQPSAAAESTAQLQRALARPGASLGAVAGLAGALPPGARQLYEEAARQPEAGVIPVTTRNGTLPAMRTEIDPAVGVRYSVMANTAGGDARTVQIVFTAAADGDLQVTSAAGAVLVSARVEHLKPFVTRPLAVSEKQVSVSYSRRLAAAESKAVVTGAPAAKDAVSRQAARVQPMEETLAGVTYVAARTAQGQLSFQIELK